jgi:hypothetical protein
MLAPNQYMHLLLISELMVAEESDSLHYILRGFIYLHSVGVFRWNMFSGGPNNEKVLSVLYSLRPSPTTDVLLKCEIFSAPQYTLIFSIPL